MHCLRRVSNHLNIRSVARSNFSSSACSRMKIVPVLVSKDNYAYLVIDEETKEAAAVDIFDVPKVAAKAKEEGVSITCLLTTHHHKDHSGGNAAFAKEYPNAKIYGGSTRIAALNSKVVDKDEISITENITARCLATPCHTQDSICYYVTDAKAPDQRSVFTGDTLFIGGCGRFFEGTAEEMHKALSYLGDLPEETLTWIGHEYTASNLKFGAHIDPENKAIQDELASIAPTTVTTGRTTVGDEKRFNVFMRLDSEAVRKATGATNAVDAMDRLRTMKNEF